MIVKLLTEHHLECLSLKGGCRFSSESTLVKMPHCWKSHVTAHIHLPVYQLPVCLYWVRVFIDQKSAVEETLYLLILFFRFILFFSEINCRLLH